MCMNNDSVYTLKYSSGIQSAVYLTNREITFKMPHLTAMCIASWGTPSCMHACLAMSR